MESFENTLNSYYKGKLFFSGIKGPTTERNLIAYDHNAYLKYLVDGQTSHLEEIKFEASAEARYPYDPEYLTVYNNKLFFNPTFTSLECLIALNP